MSAAARTSILRSRAPRIVNPNTESAWAFPSMSENGGMSPILESPTNGATDPLNHPPTYPSILDTQPSLDSSLTNPSIVTNPIPEANQIHYTPQSSHSHSSNKFSVSTGEPSLKLPGQEGSGDPLDQDGEPLNLDDFCPPPPDGGWGWVVVFASFVANMIVDGIILSFGVMMDEFVYHFKTTRAIAALAGSLMVGLSLLGGPLISGAVNVFGSRKVMMTGGVVAATGFFLARFSKSVFFLLITFGVVAGIGCGMIYLPAIVHVSYYFESKRALATGIAVSGSGIGGCFFAPLTVYLLHTYSWRGAVWVLAGFALNCCICGALLRPIIDPEEEKRRQLQQEAHKRKESIPEARSRKFSINFPSRPSRRTAHSMPNIHPNGRPRTKSMVTVRMSSDSKPRHRKPKLTARTYAQSQYQLNSRLAKSEFSLRAGDFRKPLCRNDIFFAGSIKHLPEYYMSNRDLAVYRQSTIALPRTVQYDETDNQITYSLMSSQWCGCMPGEISAIFLEMVDMELLRKPAMVLLCVANVLTMLAFYIPFVFIINFAVDQGIEDGQASLLLSVLGVTNTVGRILCGWLSDNSPVSASTIVNVCLFLSGIITILLPFMHTFWLLAIYCAIFGFLTAAYNALLSIVLVDYFGLENLTNSFGLIILFRGLAGLISSPIGGALYDVTESYTIMFVYTGALFIAASIVGFVMRIAAPLKIVDLDLEDDDEIDQLPISNDKEKKDLQNDNGSPLVVPDVLINGTIA